MVTIPTWQERMLQLFPNATLRQQTQAVHECFADVEIAALRQELDKQQAPQPIAAQGALISQSIAAEGQWDGSAASQQPVPAPSIDSREFRDLCLRLASDFCRKERYDELIAHIDTWAAQLSQPRAVLSDDAKQIADIILSDPDGGAMVISSPPTTELDGAMRFTVTNPETGRRFGVYLGLSELTATKMEKS